ncbi:uncharacterized protein LOC126260600 [Schistocerca nitens]|uniref:uncharacterized protein LOC126260600 n=1 Tax=Schistocerca nitens TaxID=7011 RepID=UPI0021191B62|nr:uncharacterized protein LOC126260600 [Schistocerca nitens]
MVYGQNIHIAADLIEDRSPTTGEFDTSATSIVQLRQVSHPGTIPGTRHGHQPTFMHKDLSSCAHIMLKSDIIKPPLQQPYLGPYKVLCQNMHTMEISYSGKSTVVSIERVKPAYMPVDGNEEPHPANKPAPRISEETVSLVPPPSSQQSSSEQVLHRHKQAGQLVPSKYPYVLVASHFQQGGCVVNDSDFEWLR